MAQAGRLNERVTIEQRVKTGRSLNGQDTFEWIAFERDVAASKRDLRGQEYLEARQTTAQVDTVWEIYWRDDITPNMQINHDGRLYDIQGIAEVGTRHDRLQIMSQRLIPDG